MSLHKFAQDVASKGRGDDSLLIHMTPDEVQRLQAFAQANGRSLTINPDTGLPEAGMLSDLFKSIAPIALGAFLGPAGFGLSSMMAGVATGGITALATGSLSRGLMAGLGAYGGAGLADSFMNAGANTVGNVAGAMGVEGAATGAGSQAAMLAAQNAGFGAEGLSSLANSAGVAAGAAPVVPSTSSLLSSGFNAATANPSAMSAFAKQNFGNIAAAAAPIMAGAMVPTTTKMPEDTNPAYIRQKLYDPYTQTFKSLKPVKASEWGDRNFSDAYTNPQTGQMATLDVRQPTPMAGGGIVALAGGGVSDAQVVDWFKANPGANDQKIAEAMQQFNVDPTQVARATGTQDKLADYETRYQTATNQNVLAAADKFGDISTATQGGTGTAGIADYMDKSGIDAKEYATALASRFGPASAGSTTNPYTAEGIQSLYDKATMVGNQADIINAASPIKDIHDTRNGKTWVDYMDKNKLSVSDAARAFGLSDTEVQARYNAAKKPIVKPPAAPAIARGNYGNKTTDPRTTTPGDINTNPDNTVTVTPNVPGRPTGGFPGMGAVRDAYTAGGGSLGYIPKAPKDMAEFNEMYNKQTGDSLAAYDYLMGKGGAKYPTQSVAASTGINRPYWTGAMRYKQKFLTSNEDGTVSSSETKGNAKAFTDPKTPPTTAARTGYSWVWNESSSKWEEAPDVYINQGGGDSGSGPGPGPGPGDGGIGTGPGTAKNGGLMKLAEGGLGSLGSYSDGGRLLKGPGDGVSDSIPATIGRKQQPARLADGEFVIPARIVSELGNGSTEAGAKKLYAMMDRVQRARGKTTGKNKVAANSRADKHLPA